MLLVLLARTLTLSPCLTSRVAKWRPKNPVPPVTKTFIMIPYNKRIDKVTWQLSLVRMIQCVACFQISLINFTTIFPASPVTGGSEPFSKLS